MKNQLILLVSALGFAGLSSGCYQKSETSPPAPPPPPQAEAPAVAPAPAPVSVVVQTPPIAYYYYPDAEVYYRPEARLYWWHDGGAWASGPRPPPRIVLRDDARFSVNLNVTEPWRQHDFVLKQHPRQGHR